MFGHHTITVPSPYHHHTITVPSPYHHCTITTPGALDEEKPTPVQPAEPVLPVTEPVLPTVDPVLPVTEPVVAEPAAADRQEVPDAMLI